LAERGRPSQKNRILPRAHVTRPHRQRKSTKRSLFSCPPSEKSENPFEYEISGLATGVLSGKVREQIALSVAETNACDYCLAAHSLLGKGAGLTPEAIVDARRLRANDPKADALLRFAAAVVEFRGLVSDDAVAAVRSAGASNAEIVEIVAHVALNILTNYTNHVAQTAVDFPKAEPLAALV
jgi:AhpD family alkylhydroperoxidase